MKVNFKIKKEKNLRVLGHSLFNFFSFTDVYYINVDSTHEDIIDKGIGEILKYLK